MTLTEQLHEFIERRIYPDKRDIFLKINQLDSILSESDLRTSVVDLLHPRVMESVLLRVTGLLREQGIEPIHFKGLTLANMLYDDPFLRKCRDIDFYIDPEQYEAACHTLLEHGAAVLEDFDGHHLSLLLRGIKIEMHTCFFHPKDNIPFSVSEGDLRRIEIKNTRLTTLAPTSLFLLLLLHYFTHANKGGKYQDRNCLLQNYQVKGGVQLLRFYDIALLVERFGNEIDWERCADALKYLRDCTVFQFVLSEFTDVFPEVLPDRLLSELVAPEFLQSEQFSLYPHIAIHPDRRYDDIMAVAVAHEGAEYLCDTEKPSSYRFRIDEYSSERAASAVISGIPPQSSADLSAHFDFWVQDDFLWFEFDVLDDVLTYLPEGAFPEDYEASGYCDGITLGITSVGPRYGMSVIYAYLTENDRGERYLSFYDIGVAVTALNGILQSTLTPRSDGYTAQIGIPLSHLGLSKDSASFYLNVILSDCDGAEGSKTALALDPSPTAWEDCRTYPKVTIAF